MPKKVLLAVRGGQGQRQGRAWAWGRKGREVSLAPHSADWLWGRSGLQTEHRPHPWLRMVMAETGVTLLFPEEAGHPGLGVELRAPCQGQDSDPKRCPCGPWWLCPTCSCPTAGWSLGCASWASGMPGKST